MPDNFNLDPQLPPANDMEQPTNLTPIRPKFPKKIILSICAVLIIATLAVLGTIALLKKSGPTTTSVITPSPTIVPNQTGFNINNYEIDTDRDHLPDFIDSKLGLDPNRNEVENCYQNKCDDPTFQKEYVPKHNIVIILDSSGSMGLKTGEVTKMDAAKQAIVSFIKNLDNKAQVGLIQYGHTGSNSAKDKAVSCAGAEILSPIGSLTSGNVTDILAPVKPTGWTPIGLALTKVKDMFVGKEKDVNEVFIVTDGAETCSTNPVAAAATLADSSTHIKVNVIGFAVTKDEQAGLEAINIAGKGTYTSADSSSELESIFTLNLKNWGTLKNANGCIDAALTHLALCTVNLHKTIDNFRASYINASLPSRELNANEKVYYSYIMYLQQFENQKNSELNKTKNSYVNDL